MELHSSTGQSDGDLNRTDTKRVRVTLREGGRERERRRRTQEEGRGKGDAEKEKNTSLVSLYFYWRKGKLAAE